MSRVLIVGFGSAGRRHFQNLHTLGIRDFLFHRSFKATLPHGEIDAYPTYSDLTEALSQKPDIVVIANPTALHMPVALAAAEGGCHLFIEKPLSHNLAGCDRLIELVGNKQLTAMIGCQFRFHPLLRELKQELAEGRIGRPLAAQAEWGEYLPSWHPWEDHRKSYSARPDLGGGVILTLIHPIDYLYWLFGPVNDVKASACSIPDLETTTFDDLAEITLAFKNGVMGHVHLDFVQRPPVHRLQVVGSAGRALWDYHKGELIWEDTSGRKDTKHLPDDFTRNDLFLNEMRHFLDKVRTGGTPQIPLADGIAVQEIAELALLSAKGAAHNA